MGWEAWRIPHAFTVVLRTPRPHLAQHWMLADGGDGWSHIVCMPGVTQDHIDRFLGELATEAPPPYGRPLTATPRTSISE
jgi:histidine decarboxylase